jgi:hypothetical protein
MPHLMSGSSVIDLEGGELRIDLMILAVVVGKRAIANGFLICQRLRSFRVLRRENQKTKGTETKAEYLTGF